MPCQLLLLSFAAGVFFRISVLIIALVRSSCAIFEANLAVPNLPRSADQHIRVLRCTLRVNCERFQAC